MQQKVDPFDGVAHTILETAPDAMVVVNEVGQLVLINAEAENLFGYTRQELLGKNVDILIPDDFLKNNTSRRAGAELLGKQKGGKTFPVEITLSPFRTEAGLFISAAIRDITDRKRAEIELQLKNQELEQFAFVASHDLQEPLKTVSGLIQYLQAAYNDKLDHTGKEFFQLITQATDRMTLLINCLLDYSRIEQRIHIVDVDCKEIIKQVESDLAAAIQRTGAKIHAKALPTIRAYETGTRMLFQNLITNAIKFTKPGTNPVVNVSAERVDGAWQFSFKDNGIGISEADQEKIFLIFQRLHSRAEYEGSGIGLAHCRKIVELHGGRIWVESKLGEGSTFHFTISDP